MARSGASLPFPTRDEGFAFVAWHLWQRSRRTGSRLNAGIEPTYDLVFERFIDAFPPFEGEPSFHRLYARLALGPIHDKMREFMAWLIEHGTTAPGLHEHPQGAIWAFARNWRELETIMNAPNPRPKTAVLPNPWHGRVTPVLAWDAFKRQTLAQDRYDAGFTRNDDRLILEAAIEDWRQRTRDSYFESWCPACSGVRVNDLIAAKHIARCPDHPGTARLRSVGDAVDLAPTVLRELRDRARGFEKVSATLKLWRYHHAVRKLNLKREIAMDRSADVMNRAFAKAESATVVYSERDALDDLDKITGRVSGVGSTKLETLLTEWEHIVDRSTDPCPHCGAVLAVSVFGAHLGSCQAHRDRKKATQREKGLAAAFGHGADVLVELVHERNAFRRELEILLHESDMFDDGMNWDGEAYAKSGTEDPWLAAQCRAVKLLGYRTDESPIPAKALGPVGEALGRAIGRATREANGPTHGDDARVLRGVREETDDFVVRHGRHVDCPACHRRGVPTTRLFEHLLHCRAHPAVARARQVAAELQFLGLPVQAPAQIFEPLDALDPREHVMPEQFNGDVRKFLRWLDKSYEAIELLANGQLLGREHATDLERCVSQWWMYQVASRAKCPGCGAAVGLEGACGHLMTCTALPARKFVREAEAQLIHRRGPKPLIVAGLREAADRYAMTLSLLADSCSAYWQSMRDGERGASIENSQQAPMWKAARVEAKKALEPQPQGRENETEAR